jgi:hypothetical protein
MVRIGHKNGNVPQPQALAGVDSGVKRALSGSVTSYLLIKSDNLLLYIVAVSERNG